MCPECGGVLIALDFRGIELDYCVHCGGVWVDRGELALIAELAGVASGGMTEALYDCPDKGEGKGRCPRCDRALRLVEFGTGQAALKIDRCPRKHGLWLDRGEMQALINSYGKENGLETGAVADLIADMFQFDLNKKSEGGLASND